MIIITGILHAKTGLSEHVMQTEFKIEPQLFLKPY